MPPHAGHQYLIEFARAFEPRLTVFLCSLSSEEIPGSVRFEWMRELFPAVEVVHITEEIPDAARTNEGAERIWAESLRERMDHDPAYVFASEEYGVALADALGARFVPVDPQRSTFPISAGEIRRDPFAHWDFIPAPVRPYFARRVVIAGDAGSSDARTRLARELAAEFHTVFATDYSTYLSGTGFKGSSISGSGDIARAQQASEAALLRVANRVLFTPAVPTLSDGEPGASRLPEMVVTVRDYESDSIKAIKRAGGSVVPADTLTQAAEVIRRRIQTLFTKS